MGLPSGHSIRTAVVAMLLVPLMIGFAFADAPSKREMDTRMAAAIDLVDAMGGRESIVEQINRVTGKNIAANHAEPRPGDIKDSQADIEKAATRMGYRPQVNFEDGLRKTVDWYRENLPQPISGR